MGVDTTELKVHPDGTVSVGGVSSASTSTSVVGEVGLEEAWCSSRSSASGGGVGPLGDD